VVIDLKVQDIEALTTSTVYDNNIVLYNSDITSNLKLMQYFEQNRIFFIDEIKLSDLTLTQQNDVGTLFLEKYNYTIEYNNKTFLNYAACKMLFAELDVVTKYINVAYFQTQNQLKNDTSSNLTNDNVVDISTINTNNYNILILNFFALKFRNYDSFDKYIEPSETLFDVNIDYGEYSKELSSQAFLLKQFSRYLRIRDDQIPFSNGFGSNIKAFIQRKNEDITKTLIKEDISSFMTTMSTIYNTNFKLVNIELIEKGDYALNLTVKVYMQIDDFDIFLVTIEG